MVFISRFLLSLSLLGLPASAFGFKIINQTTVKKVIELQEAYRPMPQGNETLAAPKALCKTPLEITVDPHSSQELLLRESCPVLLVTVITTKLYEDKKQFARTKSTTCYEAYRYEESFFERIKAIFSSRVITDQWGLIFHEPTKNTRNEYDFDTKTWVKPEYAINCLHPKLLEKVTSLTELPEELVLA